MRAWAAPPKDGVFPLHLEVEDTGIGIPSDQVDRVFERFLQAEATISRRFGGTGLGLTITRKLARMMGGDVSVRSVEGQGTTFSAMVRLSRPVDPVGTQSRPMVLSTDYMLPDGARIVVAEDNRVNRLLVGRYLADQPVELEFATDGHEAVTRVAEFQPDLVLMDMSMPVMNGLDATRVIRASAGHQPVIIALTANAFDTDRKSCLAAGMDGFLTKPVRRAELVAILAGHLSPGRLSTAS